MPTPSKPKSNLPRFLIFSFLALCVVLIYAVYVSKTLEVSDQQTVDQNQIACTNLEDTTFGIIWNSDSDTKLSWMCKPGKVCFFDLDNIVIKEDQCCETIDQCKKIVDEWGSKK